MIINAYLNKEAWVEEMRAPFCRLSPLAALDYHSTDFERAHARQLDARTHSLYLSRNTRKKNQLESLHGTVGTTMGH